MDKYKKLGDVMGTIITIIAFIPLVLSIIALCLSVVYAYKTISIRNREIEEARILNAFSSSNLSSDYLVRSMRYRLAKNEVKAIMRKINRQQTRRNSKAVDIYLKVFGSDHTKTRRTKVLLDRINQKLDQ